MTRRRLVLGEIGENLACRELERLGYAVVARRYRCRAGEIDIIARDGDTLVFVEVKTRDGAREAARFGLGVEAVTRVKRQAIVRVALEYLVRHRALNRPSRFDVVSVHVSERGPDIEVLRNAFSVTE